MKYRILFLAASLVCSASHALTVRDALVAAYKNNKELLAARQGVIAQHETIVQARGGFLPTVGAKLRGSVSKNMPSQEDMGPTSYYNYDKSRSGSISASQNIYRGGTDLATVKKTEHDILNVWAQLKFKEQEIFLNVIKAYLNLYAKFATVDVYKANLAFTKQQFDSASTKRAIGEETITQESLAEAKFMEAQAKLESGLADLTAAKAAFEQITGLKAPEYVDHPKELIDVPGSVDQLQDVALRENPQITQAVESLASAKQDKKIKSGALLPSLDLEASANKTATRSKITTSDGSYYRAHKHSLQYDNKVDLTLSVPLYDAGVNRSKRRQSSETIVQTRINIEKVQQDIINSCKQAYSAYLAAKINMSNTEKQVKAQEVAVEGTTQEMNAGTKILLDVLNAQSQLLQAKLDLINATLNYYTSLYQIKSLEGNLTATGLELPVEIFHPEQNYNEIKNNF